MELKDYFIKFVTSAVIYFIGLLCTVLVYGITFLQCFRDGYRNIFHWKDRGLQAPPLHYTVWDVESRAAPSSSAKRWNHAYVTVPESGLRFHYVYSGAVPSDIAISDIDGETSRCSDNNNVPTNRPKLLICAHGYPENWFTWRYILRFFDKPRPDLGEYFVVAVDMRGYGDSDKPSDYTSYHRNLLCGDIKGIALTLGYQKFSMIGHDWGAAVTWEVAENYSKSLEKAVILNGPEVKALWKSVEKNPLQILRSWYMFFFQISWAADAFIRFSDFRFVADLIKGDVGGIRNPENRITDEELEVVKYGVRHSIGGPNNYYRALLWPFAEPGPDLPYPRDVTSGDPLCETPILIIWGDRDAFLSKAIPEITAKRLDTTNGSKMVCIETSSHWVQQDEPDEVIRHLSEFLKA